MSKDCNKFSVRKIRTYIALGLVLVLTVSCSTQKNTAVSRSFHQTKTYYNIYYNGRLAYEEGIKSINQANIDNYSDVLSLYPVSNHAAAKTSSSKMDLAIEKCRKCIKLHSIHARPKKINPKRRSDPKYKLWLQSKEFNNKMYMAWMMLGQSEFHKGEFLGAIGTFRYVERLYENDPDMVAQCRLWTARAYAELGWLYEAEDLWEKVNIEDLKRKHQPLYSAVGADILLKQQRYREALPYVKQARENEKRGGYKARFEYVLGQLYQLDHQRQPAMDAYHRVSHLNPSPQLDFNARLQYASLEGDTIKTVKRLNRQARLKKNEEKQDRIYGVIGDIFLAKHDTVSALRYYQLGIRQSKLNGMDKAVILVRAGDLYYEHRDYAEAQPLYAEAIQILTNEHNDYLRVRHLSEVLDEVVVNTSTIALQDSLQHLSTLSEEEQLAIVDHIIEELIRQEEADSLQAQADARQAELGNGLNSVNTLGMLGGGNADKSWYFYNQNLLTNGVQTFQKLWGKRVLEDDWRRLSKSSTSTAAMSPSNESDDYADQDSSLSDSTLFASGDSLAMDTTAKPDPVTDPHERQYYLQQIPRTEGDFLESNEKIAVALINLVGIYRDKVGNQELSDQAFMDFCRRFPDDERLVELYYRQYLNALRVQDDSLAAQYRADIVRLFPSSEQARIVQNPDYFNHLRRIAAMQDSVYEATYMAYRRGDYSEVKRNHTLAEDSLSLSPLMPRFLFLNAIAVAKTDGQEAFVRALSDMVERYPTSELGAMAKDMLAMMNLGAQSRADSASVSTLADQRVETVSTDTIPQDLHFSPERKEESFALLIIPTDEQNLNRLLYEVAVYNFSQFLIKDFDLRTLPFLTTTHCALQVVGLESMDEAEWYIGLLRNNPDLQHTFSELGVELLPITLTNIKLLSNPFTLEDYRAFLSSK